jgi:hypothetical protein
MANKVFGEAVLPLSDGRELTLRFDFGALCEAEEAAGKGTEEMMKELATGRARLATARAMLYGGLRYHHAEVTLEDVGDLLLVDGDAVSGAMSKAFEEMADRRAAQNPMPGRVVKSKPPHGIGIHSSKRGAKAA